MRLSEVIDRIITAIEERVEPEAGLQVQLLRGMSGQLIRSLGDIELNIEIRRIPVEAAHVEGTKQAEDPQDR